MTVMWKVSFNCCVGIFTSKRKSTTSKNITILHPPLFILRDQCLFDSFCVIIEETVNDQ